MAFPLTSTHETDASLHCCGGVCPDRTSPSPRDLRTAERGWGVEEAEELAVGFEPTT
jgi:hypothetical protein